MTFYLTTSAGWGNISLALSDYVYKTDKPRVHRKLLDVVKCIDFQGLEFTDNDDEQAYEKRIAINSFTYNTIHSNLQDIVKPNEELQKLIEKYDHGLTHGIHIRRGAYSKDAENIGHHGVDENGNTALHLTAQSIHQGSVEIFKALVDIGSDIEVANNSGKTAYTLFQDRKDEWTFGDESFHAIVQILSKGSSTPVIGNKEPYIHPECLDFLAPWSKGNPESIDCSGLDLSKVETQGDEFGVKYGEGKAIAIEKISATSVYKAPDHIKECFSNAKTTIEINICSKEMYEYVNEVESKYFNKAIARWKAPISRDAEIIVGEENAKSAFKELYNSRDHFVNYRDQFCGSLYWTAGGTRKNQVYLHCKSELTKQFTLRVWEGHLKRGNGDPVYQDFPKPLFDYSTLY